MYVIVNRLTKKRYVGKTSNVASRWTEHRAAARRGKGGALGAAIRKHGEQAFVVLVVVWGVSESEAFAEERRWVRDLNTKRGDGYNLTDGGEGVSGRIMPADERARRAARQRGVKRGPYRPMSPESLRRNAEARLGLKMPDRTRSALAMANVGRKHTAEAKANMSAAKRGRPSPKRGRPGKSGGVRSQEFKEAQSERMKGNRLGAMRGAVSSDEHERRAASAAAMWERRRRYPTLAHWLSEDEQ